MIKVITQEYKEGDLAVRTTAVTFFHLPIFKLKTTTTNNVVVGQLSPVKKVAKIKGFVKYETED